MRRELGYLLLAGGVAGVAAAGWSYLRRSETSSEEVQIVFDDGATHEPGSVEAREMADIARKLLEIGV